MTSLAIVLIAVVMMVSANSHGPLSKHFQHWLKRNREHNVYSLAGVENYGKTGSFGGRSYKEQRPVRTPILFIHGNSDSALDTGDSDWTSGWNKQVDYFKGEGYTSAELYGMTYGDRNISNSFTRQVTCADLLGHRRFLEAILDYTGSEKINIIAHSMGVTLARKIIKGGKAVLLDGTCDLGDSLSTRIETLVAIAGANYGMCVCSQLPFMNACNPVSGFFPGTCESNPESACGNENAVACEKFSSPYATFLSSLNDYEQEAVHVISVWSDGDEVIGNNNSVWGRLTSLVPRTEYHHVFEGLSHMQLKTDTVAHQFNYIQKHYKK